MGLHCVNAGTCDAVGVPALAHVTDALPEGASGSLGVSRIPQLCLTVTFERNWWEILLCFGCFQPADR